MVLSVQICDIHSRESYEYNKSKLWTAPEYLREEDRVFSRPGDIYSLGVILHEIIERAGVWALNTNTNEDDDEDYLEPKVRVRENFKLQRSEFSIQNQKQLSNESV